MPGYSLLVEEPMWFPSTEAEGGEPWQGWWCGLALEGRRPSWNMKREPQTSLAYESWPRLWFTMQIWRCARAILILHEAVRGPQA